MSEDPTGALQDLRHCRPIPIKKSLVIVNNFVVNTTRFLNRFSAIVDEKLLKLRKQYENKIIPKISVGADTLMSKYKIPEGKQLGKKLKMIEEEWVKNNFKISDQQVEYIVKD